MLSVLVHAVSAVLLFWHWLLAGPLGLSPGTAWVLSIFLLVATVRSLVAPLSWIQLRNGRRAANLRPELHRIRDKWLLSSEPDAGKHLKWEQEQLRREHDVSVRAGCIAPLVQVPVVLGLYQMVVRMVRAHDDAHATIGFLNPGHIHDFLNSTFLGVPLPVFYSMSDYELGVYGANFDQAARVLVPLILVATLLTSFNMAYSMLRLRMTLDWSSRFSRRMARVSIIASLIGGAFPLLMGFFGPAPLALALYWVCNNLWTVAQVTIMMSIINRTWPLSDEFREYNSDLHQQFGPSMEKRRRYRTAQKRRKAAEKEARKQGKQLRPRKQSARTRQLQEAARKRAIVRLMRPSGQDALTVPGADGGVPVTGGALFIRAPEVPEPTDAGRRPRPPTKYLMPGQHVPPEVLAALELSGRERTSFTVRMRTPAKGWK